jgi:hypothetical protein
VTGGASTSSFYVEGSKTWIVPAVAGSRYHFSAMVRSDLGRGLVRIKILEYLSGVRVGEGSSADVTLSAGWQQLQLDYTSTQANSIIYFTLKASPNSISESFDLDDASACPIIVAPSAAATLADGTEGALGGPVYIKPTVAPNPVAGMSKLMFSTSRPGPLHVAVYDVSGRQVRMLADESFAPAGLHALPLGNEGRARLESGVYFYRIRSVDGLAQGRFVVMK